MYTTRLKNKRLVAFRHFNADISMKTLRCGLGVRLVRSDFSVGAQCVSYSGRLGIVVIVQKGCAK